MATGALDASTDLSSFGRIRAIIERPRSPVDEVYNPDPDPLPRALAACDEYFRDGQLIVLRSTLYHRRDHPPR